MRVFTLFVISSNVLTYSVHEALINVYFSVLSFISFYRTIYFFIYIIHSSIHSAIIYSIVHPFIFHEVDHKLFQFFVYLYTISTNYFICYFFCYQLLTKVRLIARHHYSSHRFPPIWVHIKITLYLVFQLKKRAWKATSS